MSPAERNTPLLTEAERLTAPKNELAPASVVCNADDCPAPAAPGSIRIAMQEIWFTCQRGHLNVLGCSAWAEAA